MLGTCGSRPILTCLFTCAALGGWIHAEPRPRVEFLFNEGSGTTVANSGSLGSLADGLLNGPGFSEPALCIGNSLFFDGMDDFVRVPNPFNYGARLTIEAWVRPQSLDGQRVIWDDYGNPGVLLAISNGRVQFGISTANHPGGGISLTPQTTLAPGEWSHVAAVYDGTEMRVFINGVDTGESRSTGGEIIDNAENVDPAIGSDNVSTTALNFHGRIDDFRIYDRALGPEDLALGYFDGSPLSACQRLIRDELTLSAGGRMALTPGGQKMCMLANISANRGFFAVVDLDSGQSSSQIIEGGIPGGVVASPDGTGCWVSLNRGASAGENRVDFVNISGASGEPIVFEDSISLESQSINANGPKELAINSTGTKLFVAGRGASLVHIIDIASRTLLPQLQVGAAPWGIGVTPDDTRAYAATPSSLVCIDAENDSVGGANCQGAGIINLSVNPNSALTDIAISPCGTRAYIVFNTGDSCIFVVDIDPDSPTFNQELPPIPTTSTVLQALSAGRRNIFVAGRGTREVLVFDRATATQTHRLPVGDVPFDILVQPGDRAVAYISKRAQTWSLELSPGAWLSPDKDERKTDALADFGEPTDCPDPSRPDQPDPGIDEPLNFVRDGNRILVYRPARDLELLREILLLNPHPLDGRPQTILAIDPSQQAPADSGSGTILRWIKSILQGVPPTFRQAELRINGYDPSFRPSSAVIRTDFSDAMSLTGTIIARDEGSDGLTDHFDLEIPGMPDMQIGIDLLASSGDLDFARVAIPFPTNAEPTVDFLPLGDTNGDGMPDSPAFDFDGGRLPDPDLPLGPFLTGTPDPAVELTIHFAQFGDGEVGFTGSPAELDPKPAGSPINISSLISLFNLDPENPAQATVLLRGSDGTPLTVDLNGEEVEGEKEIQIPAGGLIELATDGRGPLISGYVVVRSDRAVAGVISFAGAVGIAGVGVSHVLAKGFVAPIETSDASGINTGLAITNLQERERTLALALSDPEGMLLATGDLLLPNLGHRALFVNEIDWVAEEGVDLNLSSFTGVVGTTEKDITATVIQTSPRELATQPVAPNYAKIRGGTVISPGSTGAAPLGVEPVLNQKIYFAQFGNGTASGFQVFSQILLINLTGNEATARVQIRDDNGNPLNVTLNGENLNGEKTLNLPAGGLRILRSDGMGDLISGSVRVCSDQALAGVVLFGGSAGTAGVGASATASQGLEAPVRNKRSEQLGSGIAVVNVEQQALLLQLRLCDAQNDLLATASIPVAASGHRALFLEEIDWVVSEGKELSLDDFSGILKIEAEGQIGGTVIETRPGVFATQPVVPSLF